MVHELSMLPKLGATRIAALAVVALVLSACGDSVGLESAPKVASVSDLASCTAENAGEAVFVEDERMLYTCGEDGWRAELEPAEYERDCGTDVASNDSVSKCGADGTFTDSRDGRIYKCVTIGDQVWMAENLDFGEIVHSTTNQTKASAAHAQKYCYGDDSTNCSKYGGLYQWHTAMGLRSEYNSKSAREVIQTPHHRGICPAGWHVPTQEEWEKLVEFVQSPDSNNAGKMLKSNEGWERQKHCVLGGGDGFGGYVCLQYSSGVNGADSYGWSALPGGHLGEECKVGYKTHVLWCHSSFLNKTAEFWSSTEVNPNAALAYSIGALASSVQSGSANKMVGARSVRCVQD